MYKIAKISAIVLCSSVVLFAFSMIINNDTISYTSCIVLSWSYVVVTICFMIESDKQKTVYAYIGCAFSIMYAIIIQLVYYTQLTTVKNDVLTREIVNILSYKSPGSLLFNLDLYGYGLMALSTLFIGLSIKIKNIVDKILKAFLISHGIFAPFCFIIPILNIFNRSMGSKGNVIGITILMIWCIIFTPVCILSYIHFRKKALATASS